jgi:hypothetical protein
MSRLYELLGEQPEEEPAVALREAQCWLRGLTIREMLAHIAAHPVLRQHQATRGAARRAESMGATTRPFSKIKIWGAFIFSGA